MTGKDSHFKPTTNTAITCACKTFTLIAALYCQKQSPGIMLPGGIPRHYIARRNPVAASCWNNVTQKHFAAITGRHKIQITDSGTFQQSQALAQKHKTQTTNRQNNSAVFTQLPDHPTDLQNSFPIAKIKTFNSMVLSGD